MEIINNSEEDFSPAAKNGADHISLALDELIAEIDREIGANAGTGPGQEEELLELTRVSAPAQNQFILFVQPGWVGNPVQGLYPHTQHVPIPGLFLQ